LLIFELSGRLAKIEKRTPILYRKFYTEEQYQKEGETFKIKALDDLVKYCKGPSCDIWTVVSKLKHPQRF